MSATERSACDRSPVRSERKFRAGYPDEHWGECDAIWVTTDDLTRWWITKQRVVRIGTVGAFESWEHVVTDWLAVGAHLETTVLLADGSEMRLEGGRIDAITVEWTGSRR